MRPPRASSLRLRAPQVLLVPRSSKHYYILRWQRFITDSHSVLPRRVGSCGSRSRPVARGHDVPLLTSFSYLAWCFPLPFVNCGPFRLQLEEEGPKCAFTRSMLGEGRFASFPQKVIPLPSCLGDERAVKRTDGRAFPFADRVPLLLSPTSTRSRAGSATAAEKDQTRPFNTARIPHTHHNSIPHPLPPLPLLPSPSHAHPQPTRTAIR